MLKCSYITDIYKYTKLGQNVLSFTQILVLLHTSHFCMGLTCTKIKTEI